jgi:hypothetical protein
MNLGSDHPGLRERRMLCYKVCTNDVWQLRAEAESAGSKHIAQVKLHRSRHLCPQTLAYISYILGVLMNHDNDRLKLLETRNFYDRYCTTVDVWRPYAKAENCGSVPEYPLSGKMA